MRNQTNLTWFWIHVCVCHKNKTKTVTSPTTFQLKIFCPRLFALEVHEYVYTWTELFRVLRVAYDILTTTPVSLQLKDMEYLPG